MAATIAITGEKVRAARLAAFARGDRTTATLLIDALSICVSSDVVSERNKARADLLALRGQKGAVTDDAIDEVRTRLNESRLAAVQGKL